MKLLSSPGDRTHESAAVAIGNFDGVHRGHQAILEALRREADHLDVPGMVLTFEPHPVVVLSGGEGPPRLATRERRRELLASFGIDVLLEHPFDRALADLDPEPFARSILSEGLGAVAVVVGEAFRFGRDRAGDVEFLQAVGEELGFVVTAVPPLRDEEGEVISATRIRRLVACGEVERAGGLLGRPHALTGVVVSGAGRGAQLGFPTANLAVDEGLVLPARGVYATRTRWDGESRGSVTNIGLRPTFGDRDEPVVESHLLDYDGELAGTHLEVELLKRLRGEKRFDSVEALRTQIQADIAEAEGLLGR